jgi:predicted nucleotidyltransferase component of viral defense system
MNLFDQLVTEAIKNQPNLASLRVVVEKELLHHDILRTLSQNNLLTDLTFIGGTCLRACYGGIRLSEDLDFTGGADFSRDSLSTMAHILTENLNDKYGLHVIVSEPVKDIKNVDTWKIKIETRPQQKHLPAQRINIDICSITSYEKQPMMLLNPYGVDMGTNGLVLQAQSRVEIYTDKLLAFALRPNRIKHRDLWDIIWLHQQGIKPSFKLIPSKLQERKITQEYFLNLFEQRCKLLLEDKSLSIEFNKEMYRFLPSEQINKTIEQNNLWSFIVYLMGDLDIQIRHSLA